MSELWQAPPLAMHIPEGLLSAGWAAVWFLVAAPFLWFGLRAVVRRQAADPAALTLVALLGAAVFVISCMPVPVLGVGTCSHPCGTGLAALMIGSGPTIVVSAVALLFQALFLQHGGLTTLGANTVSMGVVGALSAVAVFHGLRRCRVSVVVAAFAAGLLSDWAVYAMTSLQLALALHGSASLASYFLAALAGFAPTQVPLGIAEGLMTAAAYRFVLLRRPELLPRGTLLECASGEQA